MTAITRQEGPEGLFIAGAFASPRAYFEEVVSPNVDIFLLDQGSKQFAFNAAIGLYHMVDYICEFAAEHGLKWFPDSGEAGIKRYRNKLLELCPEFSIAEAVALVYKHYRIGHARAKQIAPSIVSVKRHIEIVEGNTELSSHPEEVRPVFEIDFTKPYKARESIIVIDTSGKTHILHEIFSLVRDMWRKELENLDMDGATPEDLKRAP